MGRLLLAPSLLGLAALAAAFAVMAVSGTNRTRADYWLGHAGLASVPAAVVAEVVRTIVLGRAGRGVPLLVLSGLARLAALVGLGLAWIAAHLA